MGVIGSALALPRETVPNSVLESVTSVMMPGDLVTTPSIAAFLRDDWVGLGSNAQALANNPDWMQTAALVAADNATVVIGHVAAVTAGLV
jgi:hypothetical protein